MTDKVIDVLSELAQLDIDAVRAYELALDKIEDKDIFNEINNFKHDHIRHIDELNAMIVQYGGQAVENTPDLKGYLIEGMTYLQSITGTKGALKAMRTNEETTNKNYRTALQENPNLPDAPKSLLEKNYADEKRHLDYIVKVLDEMKENNVTY